MGGTLQTPAERKGGAICHPDAPPSLHFPGAFGVRCLWGPGRSGHHDGCSPPGNPPRLSLPPWGSPGRPPPGPPLCRPAAPAVSPPSAVPAAARCHLHGVRRRSVTARISACPLPRSPPPPRAQPPTHNVGGWGGGGVLSLQTRPRAWGTRGHRRPHVPPTRDPRRPPTRGPPRPPHPHPRPADSVPLSPTPTRGSPRPTALPGAAGRHAAAAIHPHRPPRRRTDGEVPTAQRRRPQTTPPIPPPALGHPLPSTPPPTHPPVSSSPLTLRPRWHRTHGDGTVETHGRDGTGRDARRSPIGSARGAERNTGGQSARRPPTDPPTPPDGPPDTPCRTPDTSRRTP